MKNNTIWRKSAIISNFKTSEHKIATEHKRTQNCHTRGRRGSTAGSHSAHPAMHGITFSTWRSIAYDGSNFVFGHSGIHHNNGLASTYVIFRHDLWLLNTPHTHKRKFDFNLWFKKLNSNRPTILDERLPFYWNKDEINFVCVKHTLPSSPEFDANTASSYNSN